MRRIPSICKPVRSVARCCVHCSSPAHHTCILRLRCAALLQVRGHNYQKALRCLRQLRTDCKKDDDTEEFNNEMRKIKKEFEPGMPKHDFWGTYQPPSPPPFPSSSP